MDVLTYGIVSPKDLLDKLQWDADKLGDNPHPYDIFNFFLTAYALAEWSEKFYFSGNIPKAFSKPTRRKKLWTLPADSNAWIVDKSCLPNELCDVKLHISNALSICAHTANASKHFNWTDGGGVKSISGEPVIDDWYKYSFTSTEKDVYIDFDGYNYGLKQIKSIVLQFYVGLLDYGENCKCGAYFNKSLSRD